MDELTISSTAIYGGNLARTFEYRTTGVHATPHLHWSFSLQEGVTVSCPVLVAEGVVYVGDSAGFFSAIDARSGDLLWCFATDWVQDGGEPVGADASTGVTAFCLAGRVGYVASACQTLYEVDLSNGQVIRSWNREALEEDPYEGSSDETVKYSDDIIVSLLFYGQLVLINYLEEDGGRRISCFDPATGNTVTDIYPSGLFGEELPFMPVTYSHPQGDFDVIYFSQMVEDNSGSFVFYAINLSEIATGTYVADSTLWSMGEDYKEYAEGLFTILDDTLYTVGTHCDANGEWQPAELLALDPFTGAVQWRYASSWDEHTWGEDRFQLAAASHLIFLVTYKGVEAVDAHTQQQRWKWTSNRAGTVTDERHVLIADGLLFMLDKAGQITVLDALTGEPRWNLQTEQPITGPFSTIADATLYVVMGHTLCAFR